MSFEYKISFGPHHPSTHGVLRLKLELDGERVVSCTTDTGFLHRKIEKILEGKRFISCIPFVDRIDYLGSLIMEHAFVLAIEKSLEITPPERATFIRIIFDELTRISSHIMALGTATYDIGCLSLLLYSIEQREKIFEIFEHATGARMHPCFYIPGGVFKDIDQKTVDMIKKFINGLREYMKNVETLAINNAIFIDRNREIGKITTEIASKYSISGPNIRASGIDHDIRKKSPYSAYEQLDFKIITRENGDAYDRFIIRFEEINQSMNLIEQSINLMKQGPTKSDDTIPDLLEIKLPKNSKTSGLVETPRGATQLTIFTNDEDTAKISKIRFKTPSQNHVHIMKEILNGTRIADITAIVASLDFIVSDCDK
jgi:NADH-quinone oxidoreductase subunit D